MEKIKSNIARKKNKDLQPVYFNKPYLKRTVIGELAKEKVENIEKINHKQKVFLMNKKTYMTKYREEQLNLNIIKFRKVMFCKKIAIHAYL